MSLTLLCGNNSTCVGWSLFSWPPPHLSLHPISQSIEMSWPSALESFRDRGNSECVCRSSSDRAGGTLGTCVVLCRGGPVTCTAAGGYPEPCRASWCAPQEVWQVSWVCTDAWSSAGWGLVGRAVQILAANILSHREGWGQRKTCIVIGRVQARWSDPPYHSFKQRRGWAPCPQILKNIAIGAFWQLQELRQKGEERPMRTEITNTIAFRQHLWRVWGKVLCGSIQRASHCVAH